MKEVLDAEPSPTYWKFLRVIIYILVFNKGFDKEKVTNVTMKEGVGGSDKSKCYAECKLTSKL